MTNTEVVANITAQIKDLKAFIDTSFKNLNTTSTTTPTPTPAPAPAPSPTPVPSTSQKVWGAFDPVSFTNLQTLVGKKANIQAIFLSFSDPFPTSLANTLKNNGQTLMIYHENNVEKISAINSGTYDGYLSKFASDAKASGCPVIMSYFHEMNLNEVPWSGALNGVSNVVQAFKHVHDLYANATNVKQAWVMNNVSIPTTIDNTIAKYYPGDAYVDIIGIDGFNFNNPWQSFAQVFNDALSQVSGYNKPIMLTSVGCAEGSLKAQWFTDMFNTIKNNSKIQGFIVFNENKEQNWLINSDAAALTAFKNGLINY